MSVLREAADDEEFRTIIRERLQRPDRMLKGFITFACEEVRQLRNNEGHRLYYVADTDLERLPHHADVLATVLDGSRAQKRQQRSRMMDMLRDRMQAHEAFRGGAFSEFAVAQQAGPGANGP